MTNPEPDLTTEAGQFTNGMGLVLNNIEFSIREMTERLERISAGDPKYQDMEATYRGMLAAWRICETAILDAMKQREDGAS